MSLLDINDIDDYQIYKNIIQSMLKKYWGGRVHFNIDEMNLILDINHLPNDYYFLGWNLKDDPNFTTKFVYYENPDLIGNWRNCGYAPVKINNNGLKLLCWKDVEQYIERGKL